jgi:CHAT domain-containing protein
VDISVLPNASCLQYLVRPAKTESPALLALGNPDSGTPSLDLPHAQEEVKAIARLVEKHSLLTRKQASETTLKSSDWKNISLLHIAAHGRFVPANPLTSALLLAADDKNDGALEAFEIFLLSIQPRLVVLSACNTGIGIVHQGDEVQGLNRAFLYAGAGGVLSSLWKVPDEQTATLMESFYRDLREMPAQRALRCAQLELIKKNPEPFYWAAFYVTGGPDL